MKIVYMGTPRFAIPPLEYLVRNNHEVAAVFTQRDRPAGRGRELSPSPVKIAARELGLPVLQPLTLKTPEVAGELAAIRPDAIVVCAYGLILPRIVLDLPVSGCLNVHPSLLPRHRGATPVAAAILAGDEFTGVSVMVMDEGLDTGPVLSQAQIPVQNYDTTASLSDKLSILSAGMLIETLGAWARHEVIPNPQDSARATYSYPLKKEAGRIDWRRPAPLIWRQVRGFQPWPGAYTTWNGKQMKILAAEPRAGTGPCAPGTVMAPSGTAGNFSVCAGEGMLEVQGVQLEGKRAVGAADFWRGQRGLAGSVLGS